MLSQVNDSGTRNRAKTSGYGEFLASFWSVLWVFSQETVEIFAEHRSSIWDRKAIAPKPISLHTFPDTRCARNLTRFGGEMKGTIREHIESPESLAVSKYYNHWSKFLHWLPMQDTIGFWRLLNEASFHFPVGFSQIPHTAGVWKNILSSRMIFRRVSAGKWVKRVRTAPKRRRARRLESSTWLYFICYQTMNSKTSR